MKVTKQMIERAEREHFNKEDYTSLQKSHALKYLYYKQRGDLKTAAYFGRIKGVRALAEKMERGSSRNSMFKPTQDWGLKY